MLQEAHWRAAAWRGARHLAVGMRRQFEQLTARQVPHPLGQARPADSDPKTWQVTFAPGMGPSVL